MPALAVDPDPRELEQLAENTPPQKTAAPPAPSLADIEKRVLQGQIGAFDQTIAATGDEAKALQEKQAAQAPFQQDLQDTIKQSQTHLGQVPKTPTAPPVPTQSQYIDKEVAKGLAVVAMLTMGFGMFGSRSRGQMAMAGLTGAMQGFHEGNEEKYKAGMAEYKEQIKEQQLQFENQMAEHDAILRDDKLNLSQKMQALELAGIKGDNKILQAAAQKKDMGLITKHGEEILKGIAAMQGAQNRADQLSETIRFHNIEAAHQNAALAEQQRYHNQVAANKGAEKRAPAGSYFDKADGDFTSMPPTVGEINDDPKRFVKMTPTTTDLTRYIVALKAQLPDIRALAEEVLPSNSVPGIGSALGFLRGKTAAIRPGGAKLQEYKELRQALINEAGNVENRSRGLTKYLREAMEEQFPHEWTDKTVAARQFDRMEKIIDARLGGIIGDDTVKSLRDKAQRERVPSGIPEGSVKTKETKGGKPVWRAPNGDFFAE